MFKKELDKDVAGDTSGNFAKLLLALVQVSFILAWISFSFFLSFFFNLGFWHLIFLQAKRAEASSVVDFEKIDQDARVGY